MVNEDSSSATNSSSRRLTQTTISSYFRGQVRRVPRPPKGPKRKRAPPTTCDTMKITEKRRLFVEIFSEDEDDSENDVTVITIQDEDDVHEQTTVVTASQSGSASGTVGSAAASPAKPLTLMSLNKPKPNDYSPKKPEPVGWHPRLTSTPRLPSGCGRGEFLSTDLATDVPKFLEVLITVDGSSKNTSGATSLSPVANISVHSTPKKKPKTNYEGVQRLVARYPDSSSSSDSDGAENTNASNKIRVLENVVATPPKSKPRKVGVVVDKAGPSEGGRRPNKKRAAAAEGALKSEKKVNFQNLDVMKDFLKRVLETPHLKCLVSEGEERLLLSFFNMDKRYQYLCVKLFTWRPVWYNVFKYAEGIGLRMGDDEVVRMYNFLKDRGFILGDYGSERLDALLHYLDVKQLRDLYRCFKLAPVPTLKEKLVAKLLEVCSTQSTLTPLKSIEQVLRAQAEKRLGLCIKMNETVHEAFYRVYLLNTFANPVYSKPQDYFKTLSVLDVVYPKYKVEDFLIFYTEEEFTRYLEAVKCRNEFEKMLEAKNSGHMFQICTLAYNALQQCVNDNTSEKSRPPYLQQFTAAARYVSVLSAGLKHLTTAYHQDVKKWIDYLLTLQHAKHKRGFWYCHLVLIQARYMKEYERAAQTTIQALEKEREHFSEIQLHNLAARGKVLNKKTYKLPALYHDRIAELSPPSCDRNWPSITIDRRTLRGNEPGRKRKYVSDGNDGGKSYSTVEETALNHYLSHGYPKGEHFENSLIGALFCLYFWDVIYEVYVKGTFVCDLQNVPLDMYTAHFYLNREDVIKKRLEEVRGSWSEEELKDRLVTNFAKHSHETALCRIESVVDEPETLCAIVGCIGRGVLSKIFERLVMNYREYHSGLPDLLVWNVETKECKFVEVKGEHDTLSVKQKLWLNHLMDSGAQVEVCHVHSIGSKRTKGIKKKTD